MCCTIITNSKLFFVCLLALVFLNYPGIGANNTFTLISPDKNTRTTIEIGNKITFWVAFQSQPVIKPSAVALDLENGKILGKNPKLKNSKATTVNTQLKPLYGKRAFIQDHYNELRLQFNDNYAVVFRAYNKGLAYRFETQLPGKIKVQHEELALQFEQDYPVYTGLTKDYNHSYEFLYNHQKISEIAPDNFLALPFVAEAANGVKVAVTEADLYDYAGLYFKSAGAGKLTSSLPPVPLKTKRGGWMNFTDIVTESADYIAETEGTRSFPWRIFAFAARDADLLDIDLVYQLSRPAKPGSDFTWVKTGKVAWDWWNSTNLTGVPFKSGVNTETYKYFIDFAAANNIRYVNLDEGWSDQFDLLKMRPEVNMVEILEHAKKRTWASSCGACGARSATNWNRPWTCSRNGALRV